MKTILCFGDSNTHGYDASVQGRFDEFIRWPCLLQQYLGQGFRVIEEGLSGRTTVIDDPLTEGLNGLRAITPCLLTHEPVDLLVIMLGTNDTKERFGFTARNIADGLRRLIIKASQTPAWKTQPAILVVAPPPVDRKYRETDIHAVMGDGCVEKSEALAEFFQKTALEQGCSFLDAAAIEGVKMSSCDYMHLDREGHGHLARKLAEIIPEICGCRRADGSDHEKLYQC